MSEQYKDLKDLMLNNQAAQLFYDKLPMNLKHRVSEQCKDVCSLEDLQHRTNNLK